MMIEHFRQPDETGFFEAEDGIPLRYALYRPPDARGTVVIVSGRSEYIEKYAETITELATAGYAVATFDLRGQGGSGRLSDDPRAGHVRRFSDFTDDLRLFSEVLVFGNMPAPYTLMGHSLGGLISLSHALERETRFDGLILLAPFVGLRSRHLPESVVRLVAGALSALGQKERPVFAHPPPAPFEEQQLTADRARYERNMRAALEDPPYILGAPTFGWLSACLAEGARLRSKAAPGAIAMPVLMLSAGDDSLIPAAAQKRIAEGLGARHVVLPDAGHELLQERDAVRVPAMAEIFAFLEGINR